MNLEIEENSSYPLSPIIVYKEKRKNIIQHSFSYEIIKEGVYLKAPLSAYTSTSKGKQYKIPDKYGVKTTIGRYKKKKVIYCSINYENNCPIFCISYGENFEYKVSSTSSSSAANKWEKAINPDSKTAWSGTLVFGLQLESVNKAREAKNRELKSIENYSNHTILRRAKKFGSQALELLKSKSQDNYSKKDLVTIKAIDYLVNNGKEDLVKTKQNQLATVQALDKAKISREGYRKIAAVNPIISRKYAVLNERILLTKQMEADIKITQVNLEFLEVEIDSTEVENVDPKEITNMARIGAQCSVKDLLNYIIPYLEQIKILKYTDPVIHLRISEDGRNVGHKNKHVMVTIMILNDIDHHHESDFHYTLVLYPRIEKYKTLKFMLSTLLEDLWFLKENGLQIGTTCWNFEFYFSADLKFLAICLGLNAANSIYFCPWCNVNKNQYEDIQADWRIAKTMDQLRLNWKNTNGHINAPLFNMIPLENWVCDELHVLLRIYDRLWTLVIAEIKSRGLFNDITRKIIVDEMKRINISFQFWKIHGSNNWDFTPLIGQDKLKVLQLFNLGVLFRPSRAKLIRQLWDQFVILYQAFCNQETDPLQFKKDALSWLNLFLTPSQDTSTDPNNATNGLYLPSNVTPYIHIFVYHGWELMQKHQKWGIKAFSCAAVEHKNHDQSSLYFCKTFKNGGNSSHCKAAVVEILEYENRTLYYNYNNIQPSFSQNKKLRIC